MAEAAPTATTTGKRKTAIARVRLKLGQGNILVNGKPLAEYFSREVHQIVVREPLEATDTTTRYDIVATLRGGGIAGQAGALRHGISRALLELEPEKRATLKARGFVTRDARKKERKKYGQRGARARFQFSKR